ncbi:general substrate transporter [Daldinia caldariorum]|uniref:general substrate transporter n=1 Tax=Daldinia caldariorum TaxID=326644 RepID=UPI0020072A99|nr:general substrate transporter [Daldinia caldariorum]KAI1467853.1 general substrate transporter [Daldinia caldariorum]
MKPHTYQFLVGVFASMGSVLFGYDLGVIAGVVGSTSYAELFQSNAAQDGAVVSLFTGGAFFGAMFAGPAGDMLGRRLTIMLGAVIFLLGGAIQTAAQTIDYLYGGRAIAGLGVGFLTMIIPVYQSEIAHPSIRGRVTGLQQFMLGIGAFLAGWISWGCFINLSSSAQWRIPLGIQNLPALVLAALILLFPESPRWLVDHRRADDGLRTLARLHANGDVHDPWVQAEFAQIKDTIRFEREHEAKSYSELFTNPSAFRRLFLACAIQAATQMTGVSAIQYFSVSIFAQIGISADDALKYQAINSILALVAQASCMALIDRFGRRPTIVAGNLVNCAMFVVVTVLLARFPPDTDSGSTAGWGFIIVTWLFNISFSFACGPLSWIIPAEIFDTHTRAKGVSLATMVSFAFNTLVGQITSVAVDAAGWRYFVLFAACNAANALFFWLLLPETKQVPLEHMGALVFAPDAPWIVPGEKSRAFRAAAEAEVAAAAAATLDIKEVEVKKSEHDEV